MPVVDVAVENVHALWIRDAKTSLTPNETQRNTLIAAGVYIVVIAVLW